MGSACRKPDCTVDQTGICLLNNDLNTCPERTGSPIDPAAFIDIAVPPPLSTPARNPQFPNSQALTPDRVRELFSGKPTRLIGVLGAPDAGKTAILVSLYLLLSHAKLAGYRFSDSSTLLALDEISRGARRWNEGSPPNQMTNHTELPDHRTAGFLHLRLRDTESGEAHELLIPDLPGEWSTSLIDSNRTDRLDFLKGADVLWITVDGRAILKPELRQLVLHRTGMLMQRVKDLLGAEVPPILLVISHLDEGTPSVASFEKLNADALRLGLSMTVMQVSSFSEADAVPPGTGIAELIQASLASHSATVAESLWPAPDLADGYRHFGSFQAERGIA
jgi:hypothetical protein